VAIDTRYPLAGFIPLLRFGSVSQIEGEPASASARITDCSRRALTSFALAALFSSRRRVACEPPSSNAVAQVSRAINGSGMFNLIAGFPLDWWARFSGNRFGGVSKNLSDGAKLSPPAQDDSLEFFLYCGSGYAAQWRWERWQWIVDGIHRLFLEKRRRRPKIQAGKWLQRSLVGHKGSEVMGDDAPKTRRHSLQMVVDQEVLLHESRCFLVGPGASSRIAENARLEGIPRPSWTTDHLTSQSHEYPLISKKHRSLFPNAGIVDSHGKRWVGRINNACHAGKQSRRNAFARRTL